jgi:hypothetical protein
VATCCALLAGCVFQNARNATDLGVATTTTQIPCAMVIGVQTGDQLGMTLRIILFITATQKTSLFVLSAHLLSHALKIERKFSTLSLEIETQQ